MRIEVESVSSLRFPDGSPVRAASALARLGDGWLVAQDDATHAAWWRAGSLVPVRVLPPVSGLDTFEESAGTKHLKPDFEAACDLDAGGRASVLMLGSGSSPARMRGVLVRLEGGEPSAVSRDLSPMYAEVARALDVDPDELNLEGACVVGDSLRWFHRGLPSAGRPTSSVDLDLAALLAAVEEGAVAAVGISGARRHELGSVNGVGLAVTDAVSLLDGSVLVSAAAEDTPNPRDDGPVVGSALALLRNNEVVDVASLPEVEGVVCKVEGLAVVASGDGSVDLLATVDADDPNTPSLAVRLLVQL